MLIRFILLTVLAYFIFKSLDRFFRGGSQKPSNTRRPSGNKPKAPKQAQTKSMIKDNIGEYVDFEEVDEKKDSEK